MRLLKVDRLGAEFDDLHQLSVELLGVVPVLTQDVHGDVAGFCARPLGRHNELIRLLIEVHVVIVAEVLDEPFGLHSSRQVNVLQDRLRHDVQAFVQARRHELRSLLWERSSMDDGILRKHIRTKLEELLLSFELLFVEINVLREVFLVGLLDELVTLLVPFINWHMFKTYYQNVKKNGCKDIALTFLVHGLDSGGGLLFRVDERLLPEQVSLISNELHGLQLEPLRAIR